MSRRGWLLVVLLAAACRDRAGSESPLVRAELGVFFGGQVQERHAIPFEVDRARQTQGFRVELRGAGDRPVTVRWEIDRPASRGERVAELGRAELAASERRFDREIPFKPGDPLGIWNVRVLVDDVLVLDRAVEVYDQGARERAAERRRAVQDASLP
ncbi:MAG TPA: hypothetical protein VF989_14935 [Polyangiaceae bacterium]|jgi:hypothetical protein